MLRARGSLMAAVCSVLTAIALAALVAGCGGSSGSSGQGSQTGTTETTETTGTNAEHVTLSLWSEWAEEPYKAWTETIIGEFEELHPNISINSRAIENAQFFTVMSTGMQSGKPPDLLQTEANDNLSQFVPSGEVANLTSWIEKEGLKSRFAPSAVEGITTEGQQYGLPLRIATGTQIYYNETILEENEIDPKSLKTWGDYLQAFEKLKENGVTPIALGNKEGWPGAQWWFPLLLRSVGTQKVNQLLSQNCGYKWTEPDIVKSAELYEELITNGYVTEGAASSNFAQGAALLYAGKAAFFQSGSWFPGEAEAEAGPEFKLGMSIFPTVEGGKGGLKENLVATFEAISVSSKAYEDPAKRQAALEFIDWLTTPEVQNKSDEELGSISATVGTKATQPIITRIVKEQVAGSTETVPFLDYGLSPTTETILFTGSTAITSGQLTAKEWLEEIEADAGKTKPEIVLKPQCS